MGTHSPVFSTPMGASGKTEQDSRDIFQRLSEHGVPLDNYGVIKKIVAFDLPQWGIHFWNRYGDRAVAEVLKQIDRWKAFLSKDFLLFPGQKAEVEKWILQSEPLVWLALIEANLPQAGPWILGLSFVPTGQDEVGQPVYLRPGLRITAFNVKTQERREALIPAEEYNAPALTGIAYRKAFERLGIWDFLSKGPAARRLISARKPQGWPIYTQVVIPRLYDYLLPYYKKPGHYSNKIDTPGHWRRAIFPRELLQDMLDILRMEHPQVFGHTTVGQLKADIQRYLARQGRGTKSKL